MPSHFRTLLVVGLGAACTPRVGAQATDPETRAALAQLAEQVSRMRVHLDAADPKHREACEFRAGDCLMELRDKRKELLRGRTFLECDAATDREKKARCEEDKLLDRGESAEVDRYYDYTRWCLGGMDECIVDLERRAGEEAQRELVEQRRARFFGSPLAAELELALTVADSRLEYVRSTLPPAADGLCRDLPAVAACRERGIASMAEVESYLTRGPDEYEEQTAEGLLRQTKQTEVECVALEQTCIVEQLATYGETDESRPLLDQNLALVAERTRLLAGVDPAAGQQCLAAGRAPQEAYIAANAAQYARRQVAYFRIQLARAFLKVHKAQLECLTRLAQ